MLGQEPHTTDAEAVIEILKIFYMSLPADVKSTINYEIQKKIKDEDKQLPYKDKGRAIYRVASKIIPVANLV
ncbi:MULTISPECIES: hypothetical protein [Enterobacteriaceae]|uniref:hypothetical protein n=1 Tax=Enterobacteriaceae TaxID=543 RepID=UPI0009AC216F|nr:MULTISPECIES: hypothetical protein [Enterobacteriaceae]EDL8429888.1 hypothetical protein [Salmonella enterica subsp. diarizonae]EFB5232254.1 hypothetical protein [Escherichia coli]HDU6207515.1 hypothetical protein [Klebsiella pneumoniae subsp. pneumoniae]ELW1124095.1 hypothetical protein [Escherichia coli]MBD7097022.1 hypothetical protein [Klebsiella pneumoniae]